MQISIVCLLLVVAVVQLIQAKVLKEKDMELVMMVPLVEAVVEIILEILIQITLVEEELVVKDLMVVLVLGVVVHMVAVAVAVLVKRVKQVTPLTVTQEMVVMDYHLLSLDLFHIMEVAVLETQHLLMQ
ncbi:MAG: hypothetical protein VXY81_14130 [Pseudomonadota bacterium]|nr:hypothetical protein [Pseudomonadota bacterium]